LYLKQKDLSVWSETASNL